MADAGFLLLAVMETLKQAAWSACFSSGVAICIAIVVGVGTLSVHDIIRVIIDSFKLFLTIERAACWLACCACHAARLAFDRGVSARHLLSHITTAALVAPVVLPTAAIAAIVAIQCIFFATVGVWSVVQLLGLGLGITPLFRLWSTSRWRHLGRGLLHRIFFRTSHSRRRRIMIRQHGRGGGNSGGGSSRGGSIAHVAAPPSPPGLAAATGVDAGPSAGAGAPEGTGGGETVILPGETSTVSHHVGGRFHFVVTALPRLVDGAIVGTIHRRLFHIDNSKRERGDKHKLHAKYAKTLKIDDLQGLLSRASVPAKTAGTWRLSMCTCCGIAPCGWSAVYTLKEGALSEDCPQSRYLDVEIKSCDAREAVAPPTDLGEFPFSSFLLGLPLRFGDSGHDISAHTLSESAYADLSTFGVVIDATADDVVVRIEPAIADAPTRISDLARCQHWQKVVSLLPELRTESTFHVTEPDDGTGELGVIWRRKKPLTFAFAFCTVLCATNAYILCPRRSGHQA